MASGSKRLSFQISRAKKSRGRPLARPAMSIRSQMRAVDHDARFRWVSKADAVAEAKPKSRASGEYRGTHAWKSLSSDSPDMDRPPEHARYSAACLPPCPKRASI